jgi:peroxiredoxin
MMKKILYVLAMLFFADVAWAESGINIFAYPRKVPDTPVYDRDGKAVRLDSFAGNFLLAVFWSKTCVPCLREMKDLSEFVKKTQDNGIKVILVSSESEWINDEIGQKAFLARYGGADLDYYVDKKGALATDFGIFTSPHTVLVDKESMEIGRIRGSVEWDDDDVIEYIYKLKAEH